MFKLYVLVLAVIIIEACGQVTIHPEPTPIHPQPSSGELKKTRDIGFQEANSLLDGFAKHLLSNKRLNPSDLEDSNLPKKELNVKQESSITSPKADTVNAGFKPRVARQSFFSGRRGGYPGGGRGRGRGRGGFNRPYGMQGWGRGYPMYGDMYW